MTPKELQDRQRVAEERKLALAMGATSPRGRLILVRLKHGLTQHQMADKMNLRWDTYRRFEAPLDKGYSSSPNLRSAVALRDATAEMGDEIDPGDWVDELDERSKP
jgi:DNA-binding XRE family transcriptional regulator